jgi:hypothetical protein
VSKNRLLFTLFKEEAGTVDCGMATAYFQVGMPAVDPKGISAEKEA